MKMQYHCWPIQIVGDTETTGDDDSDNNAEKCRTGGDGQDINAGSK
jgi:hypothetical protein